MRKNVENVLANHLADNLVPRLISSVIGRHFPLAGLGLGQKKLLRDRIVVAVDQIW